MTKTILKTVYELDEVKEKAVEQYRYINVDFDDWYDFLILNWKEKLEQAGFLDPEIYFSGFYSQGDGACFDCARFDLPSLLKNLDFSEEEKERILKIQDEFSISIKKGGTYNIYCHKMTRYAEIEDFYVKKQSDKDLLSNLENQIEEMRLDFCTKIYSELQEAFEDLTSDQAVYDTLQANEYLFEENGKIASM